MTPDRAKCLAEYRQAYEARVRSQVQDVKNFPSSTLFWLLTGAATTGASYQGLAARPEAPLTEFEGSVASVRSPVAWLVGAATLAVGAAIYFGAEDIVAFNNLPGNMNIVASPPCR